MYQEQQEVKSVRRYSAAIDAMLDVTSKLPQVKLELVHLFSEGYYARVLKIPAGILVVAKLHKTKHPVYLTEGSARIVEGDKVQHVKAPFVATSPVGTQRVIHAITNCTFMTVHKTNKTTLAEIEAEVIATSEEELCHGQSQLP